MNGPRDSYRPNEIALNHELPLGRPDSRDPAALASEIIPPEKLLQSLEEELNRMRRSIRLSLQNKLASLTGRSLGSLELNQSLARSIHAMLDQHGFRIRCHQCGHAAILRVSPRKGMDAGAFVFDHTVEGKRTFHGGGAHIPPIHLVAKPARRGIQRSGHSKRSAS